MDDKRTGLYGISDNKEASKTQGFYAATYVPDKFTISLLDSSIAVIDTAWAESMWAYDKKGNPKEASSFGNNFIIPIKEQRFDEFLFTLTLLDKDNEAFTNGIKENRCELNPSVLKDTIEVIVEQKNPDQEIGWQKSIVTDKIKFVKIKKSSS